MFLSKQNFVCLVGREQNNQLLYFFALFQSYLYDTFHIIYVKICNFFFNFVDNIQNIITPQQIDE